MEGRRIPTSRAQNRPFFLKHCGGGEKREEGRGEQRARKPVFQTLALQLRPKP
jgi:hypothetical protein